MDEAKTCLTCRHFRQHYIRHSKNLYVPIDKDHCVSPRLKDRTQDTPACRHYSAKRTRAAQEIGAAGDG